MKYCYIKNAEGNFMCVNKHFVTVKKYATLFTEKNAKKILDEDSSLKIVKSNTSKKLSEQKKYRMKDIPSEFLVKKHRSSHPSKFVYEDENDIKVIKKEESFSEDYLFEKLNDKCMGCVKNCKQSWKAVILSCPDYKKI